LLNFIQITYVILYQYIKKLQEIFLIKKTIVI